GAGPRRGGAVARVRGRSGPACVHGTRDRRGPRVRLRKRTPTTRDARCTMASPIVHACDAGHVCPSGQCPDGPRRVRIAALVSPHDPGQSSTTRPPRPREEFAMRLRIRFVLACALVALCTIPAASAACRDAVVLVHGNAGSPSQFDNTYVELRARGLADSEILRPDWGSKACPACNDHHGSEETPVLDALVEAIARSCTGKIDVIGHSMGVTLAAREIVKYGLAADVDTFVGIAGAYRGLWSCGTYPFNVSTSTCGAYG